MQKNNQGYLLAETIIALTVIATVITLVYAISMNNYIKQNNELMKFNTAEGLYSAKNVKKYFYEYEAEYKAQTIASADKYIDITNQDADFMDKLNIKKLYFSKYVMENNFINQKDIPYAIRKDLKSINPSASVDTPKKCDYRYVLLFKDNSYSSIGVSCIE